jgi:hypothetical protein
MQFDVTFIPLLLPLLPPLLLLPLLLPLLPPLLLPLLLPLLPPLLLPLSEPPSPPPLPGATEHAYDPPIANKIEATSVTRFMVESLQMVAGDPKGWGTSPS